MDAVKIVISLTFAMLFAVTIAKADGVGHVRWCETDTNPPAQLRCSAATMPDGNLRGTRSAATLIGEARAAARAGNCDAAIAWAAACQCHNPGPADEIRREKDAVCNYLK